MKKDLTQFKTAKWRKAVKDCVKLWETRANGNILDGTCPLCSEVRKMGKEMYGMKQWTCEDCPACFLAGGKYCLYKWKSLYDWYDAAGNCNVHGATRAAKRVLKVAKRLEELTK